MGVSVTWDNAEKTVIRYDFEGSWSWDEAQQALAKVKVMMGTVDHVVDFIADLRSCRSQPTDLLNKALQVARRTPANTGILVMVGANRFIQSLYTVFKRVYADLAGETMFVDTLEDARAFIEQRRAQRRAQQRAGQDDS